VGRALTDAGVPRGVFNIVTGGADVGSALVHHAGVDGVTFTGSSAVGMSILSSFSASYPKPAICEMGGKNPVIVAGSADLDLAVEGTARSAFGFGGQKCSAASRVFVDESIADEFIARLVRPRRSDPARQPARARRLPVTRRRPASARSVRRRHRRRSAHRRRADRWPPHHRGAAAAGNFVAPTVVHVPDDSMIWSTELFLPLIAVRAVGSLDEAIQRANAVPFGLTAGLFAEDEAEIDRFFDRIEAGVVYVNRAAGCHHWRLAGRAAVRRLEAQRHRRQARRWPVLPAAVPPRAVPHPRAPRVNGATDDGPHRSSVTPGGRRTR
jgi:1-pyrroline-5-carboxylate dehydrogenase